MTPVRHALDERDDRRRDFDAIIVGSGFGGSMCAHQLVRAGLDVLMVERGDWVARGPRNWDPDRAMGLAPEYDSDAYNVRGDDVGTAGAFHCVGGPSVFYGAASLRFRARDFEYDDRIASGSDARWPFRYDTMEPWYGRAERLLSVAGDDSADPTAPPRSTPLLPEPQLPPVSKRIADAARDLGFTPTTLPLAINWSDEHGRTHCIACTTCDAYACAIGAKNDLATVVLPPLLARGLTLATHSIARHLVTDGCRITAVECADTRSGARTFYTARLVVLAAGALASPHLILASGLDLLNPARQHVGRGLMRHCNAMVYGYFHEPPDPERTLHKRVALFDAYFGHPSVRHPAGRLGSIQQIHAPPVGLIQARLPARLHGLVAPLAEHVTGLMAMAEDQSRFENRIEIDERERTEHDMPRAVITHRYTARDRAARRALVRMAASVLRRAGARACVVFPIRTFSHALGTLRMGDDAETSPLDADGRFRGIDNLWVTDGSALPTSAAVNPSLTIAANALRIADGILRASGIASSSQDAMRGSASRQRRPVLRQGVEHSDAHTLATATSRQP